MYLPSLFSEADTDRLFRVARENPFATLITPTPEGPMVSHIPLLVRSDGAIVGHVARANPHWHWFDRDSDSLALFGGPHAYISPRWYSGNEHVPTWNYVVAHASGRPSVVAEPERVMEEMERLVTRFEGPEGWRIEKAGQDFVEGLTRAIVVFEISSPRWRGKFKLSQNREPGDRAGVLSALENARDEQSAGVARWMRELERI